VSDYADVFDGLGIDTGEIMAHNTGYDRQPEGGTAAPEAENEPELTPRERAVYDCIGMEPITADEICVLTKTSAADVSCLLTGLELSGLVTRLPGQRYVKSR
jgi:predicted Rossmann fold nucleotide-binding protein DprA/Smf involved in DNA uptake